MCESGARRPAAQRCRADAFACRQLHMNTGRHDEAQPIDAHGNAFPHEGIGVTADGLVRRAQRLRDGQHADGQPLLPASTVRQAAVALLVTCLTLAAQIAVKTRPFIKSSAQKKFFGHCDATVHHDALTVLHRTLDAAAVSYGMPILRDSSRTPIALTGCAPTCRRTNVRTISPSTTSSCSSIRRSKPRRIYSVVTRRTGCAQG